MTLYATSMDVPVSDGQRSGQIRPAQGKADSRLQHQLQAAMKTNGKRRVDSPLHDKESSACMALDAKSIQVGPAIGARCIFRALGVHPTQCAPRKQRSSIAAPPRIDVRGRDGERECPDVVELTAEGVAREYAHPIRIRTLPPPMIEKTEGAQ